MSVYKQMEEAGLTLEEIRELIELLKDVLPKVKRQVDNKNRTSILARNLRESLSKEGSIEIPIEVGESANDLEKGYKLLETASQKLSKFEKLINEC